MKRSKRKHQKIAVIQLSRIGDVLMSLPVLEALSKKYRESEIYFFVNGMLDHLLPDSPFFKWVPVHFNALYKRLTESETVQDALDRVDEELGEYFDILFDQVINLSSQRKSAILTALLHAKRRYGLVLSEDDTLIHTHPNLSLFSEIKTGRNINWVHQVEIYLSAVSGAKPCPLHKTGNYLFGNEMEMWLKEPILDKGYILISPGASIPEKQLGEAIIESLCQTLLARTDYRIVLSGTEKEGTRHREMQLPDSNRIIDYAGKTKNFRDLWNLIYHAECLICNDSGPMHMAAFLNKNTIVFSVGPAFFPETIAYNHNVLCLTPQSDCYPCPWIGFQCEKEPPCKEAFDSHWVADLVLSHIKDDSTARLEGIRAGYKTVINENGLLFYPQGKATPTIIELLGMVYQSFWKEKLFGIDARATLTDVSGRYDIQSNAFRYALVQWKHLLQELGAFLDQLLSLFFHPLRQSDPQILNQISKGVDTIFTLSDQDTVLTPLLQFYKIQYHSINADKPEKIIDEYHKYKYR